MFEGTVKLPAEAAAVHTTGLNNTAIGYGAGYNLTTGSYNIDIGIGAFGNTGETNTIRIGGPTYQSRAFIAGISNVVTGLSGAVPVVIDANGQQVKIAADLAVVEWKDQSVRADGERLTGLSDLHLGRQSDRPNAPRTVGQTVSLLEEGNEAAQLAVSPPFAGGLVVVGPQLVLGPDEPPKPCTSSPTTSTASGWSSGSSRARDRRE